MLTVNKTVESKDDQYWEPDVGKSLKGEENPLALAIAFVSWKQIYFEYIQAISNISNIIIIKCIKGEENPLAGAIAVVSWKQIYLEYKSY